ncbi:MAG: hypothetical protein EA401_12540 [Planctomycetota bacterium]|nr:MAG: hypothetical protein EA401_12540 [Planctomycetota bacterium]
MTTPQESTGDYFLRRLTLAASVTLCSIIAISIVLLALVPASFDRVYDVAHVKVAEDDNAVLHTARSLTEGMQEVASRFDLEVDKDHIVIDEINHVPGKIVGRMRNTSEHPVYHVTLSIVVRDSEGALKDVASESAQGFGSLAPGGEGYFFIERDDEDDEDDDISVTVVEASKSFLRLNRR